VLYMELIFCHPHRFLLLGMDSFITSLSICPPPKKNMNKNWRFHGLHLHGFDHNNGKFVGQVKKVGAI